MRGFLSTIASAFFLFPNLYGDSLIYNSLNNHGSIGLINMPTARFYDESSFGVTIYDGNPDQKVTMTSSPFDWLEASFFILISKISVTATMNLIQFVAKIIKIKVLILNLE